MMAKRRKPRTTGDAPRRAPAASPASALTPGPPPRTTAWGRPDAAVVVAAVLGPLAVYVATLRRTVVL